MDNDSKKGWSTREKTLAAVSVIGALLSIGLLVGLIVVLVKDNGSDDTSDICLERSCIEESAKVLAQMNLDADPCDDFYEFACGTFLKETIIPDDKTQLTAFSVIENQLKDQLRAIVNEPIEADEILPFQNVKKLYASCLNTAAIDTLDIAPMNAVLTSSMGGWPVVVGANWEANGWTWQESVARSRDNGYSVSYFLSFSVSIDSKDTTRRIIRIDQASLGLSREYLIAKFEEPFVVAYHNYQIDLAVLFGASRDNAETAMRDVLDFETELAEISMAREDRRNAEVLYNERTIATLNTDYPYNDWLAYFNSILPTESQLTLTDTVVVGALSFFEKLGDLLDKTSPVVLANYVAWRQTVGSVSFLGSRIKQRQFQYDSETSGRAVENPRWLDCVDTTLNYYPHAFGALYVRRHFKEDAKEIALDMVNNIKEEFKEILKEIDWMDDVTKEGATAKADTISEQIGYADELTDNAKLVEYYAALPVTIDEDKYFENVFKLNIASAQRNNRRLRETVDKNEWFSFVTPAIVNAFYSSIENSIKFPAGILQGAFFNAERPQYMNYGGIGFVIGHEITHGFDDQGSQYDSAGNLRNWWQNATRDAYLKKAECIINQYGNYTEPLTKLKLNGINTQGENIADNGGIKESYRAYIRWAKDNHEKRMPGLDKYSPQQMFWVAAGQVWCSTYREEAMKNRVTTGVHSPGQFRVIGPMSNTKEFADDFNCASGRPMNPVNKCEVW